MKKYLFFSGILFIATSFLYNTEAIEGFYKDVFEDEGTQLSGANLDRNCKYIGFTMERLNTNSNLTKQAEIMIKNDNDDNGYLLYPDGEPRFAIIYYHGGMMAHSSNLGEEGRDRIRSHYYNGGSQFGSAAGSYMLSSSISTYFRLWPGRMNGPNCSTTKLDYEIPVNSPLLNYFDFGGDNLVEEIYHNNGGSVDPSDMPSGTLLLALHKNAPNSMDGYGSVWSWKDNDSTGRVIGITSHPEGSGEEELKQLVGAIMFYLRDGLGIPDIKHQLDNVEMIVMDKETSDNDPAYTKIGDKQYHHFTMQVLNEGKNLAVTLDGEDGFDMHLFLAKDTFAFVHSAEYLDTSQGPDKTLLIPSIAPGTWYIGVKCATTVISNQDLNQRDEFPEYSGQLEVLNGVAYSIGATWDTAHIIVLSPDGGEEWERGQVYDITWFDDINENVRIELLKSGTPVDTLAQSVPSTGSFSWNIPDNLPVGSDYRVRITSISNPDNADISNGEFSIIVPIIIVASPNGGEAWYIGKDYNIAWSTKGFVGDVKIEYSTNNGTDWSVIANSTANDGSHPWTIPDESSDVCKIRISEASDGEPADESNGVFIIEIEPSLSLSFPVGGEVLYIDTTYTIRWSTVGRVGDVKIEYSMNNGASWPVITSQTENNGLYDWKVPSISPGTCRIRISEASDGIPVDTSDVLFIEEAPSISVSYPNGGEVLYIGMVYKIQWSTKGQVGDVKIEYSTDNGASWEVIENGVTNNGSYNWTIPDEESINCRIRISEAIDENPVDISDSTFEIAQPFIEVSSPNGGELLLSGYNHYITWQGEGFTGDVRIEYSTDNGVNWAVIVNNTANDGSHSWTIPNNPSVNCKVRVSEVTISNPFDESNEIFTIQFGTAIQDGPKDPGKFNGNFNIVPNPVDKSISQKVAFLLTPAEDIKSATVKVYDALGSIVFETEELQQCKANKQYTLADWNCKNISGRTVESGTYLAVLIIKNKDDKTVIVKRIGGVKENR